MAGSFSFDTPEEVMHILASVRASGASPAQQGDLRDLVLSYTNGGKDPSLKLQIEQQLSALGVAPSESKTTLSTSEPLDFGSSRSVPAFHAPAPVTPAPAPSPAPAPVTPVASPAPAPTPTPTPTPTLPTPSAAPVTPPPETQPVAPPSVAPTPVAPVAPAPAAPSVAVDGDPLRRVREIKALVNEKVGNPVNLVDIDNTVGREYMAALLDAMKSINNGSDISRPMDRLEAAYSAVETVLHHQPVTPEATEPVPAATTATPAPATPPALAPQPAPVTPPSEAQSVPINATVPKKPVVDTNSAERWANTEIRLPDSVPPITKPQPVVSESAVPPVVQSSPASTAPAESVAVQPPTPVAPSAAAKPAAPPAPPKVDISESPAPAVSAVKPLSSTGQPLKSVEDLPTSDSLATSSKNGDPLFTREVDDGLNQLLSDWVLFRKSGLIGTGPKGIQHPLYLKIKDLEIPILLAGRFDGATQEIKQSITDYMNGWRYEQGIIYEQGETFEHYLRRVIRHILDLQK